MTAILIDHSQSNVEVVQLTALVWIEQFVILSGRTILPHTSGILMAVLPTLDNRYALHNGKDISLLYFVTINFLSRFHVILLHTECNKLVHSFTCFIWDYIFFGDSVMYIRKNIDAFFLNLHSKNAS